ASSESSAESTAMETSDGSAAIGVPYESMRSERRVIAAAVVIVAIAKVRSANHDPRRIVTPAERTIEHSIRRKKRIGPKARIPIPACSIPCGGVVRSIHASGIAPGGIHIRACQVGGAQPGPLVEAIFVAFAIEFLRLQFAGGVKAELMILLHLDILGSDLRFNLTIEYA